ncbi:hypothetical protein SAE02_59870 [Skermanella aerolata]|uniref:Uncharacterized protein n=1 Tax=Skermanella aerolata TaxID=393310 RepID=A0A512DZH3_9PROT|nr:hypothetical protein [Skermanella aerolata]GEO41839.1 hypothetical protein SAE02_59870 [Skermanella aerolata]
MLKMVRKNIVRGVVLSVALSAGLGFAGMAAPDSGGQAVEEIDVEEMIAQVARVDAGGIEGMARGDADATKAVPASRMTWESAAPQLDPFGNEMVPVFDSAYSGREPVR